MSVCAFKLGEEYLQRESDAGTRRVIKFLAIFGRAVRNVFSTVKKMYGIARRGNVVAATAPSRRRRRSMRIPLRRWQLETSTSRTSRLFYFQIFHLVCISFFGKSIKLHSWKRGRTRVRRRRRFAFRHYYTDNVSSVIKRFLISYTFLRRLLSRNVAAFLRSTVTVFFLHALHAHRRHLRGP